MSEERIGEVIDEKWSVERTLGVGAMAAVYAARHRNGLRAALKVMHRQLTEDEASAERFLAEGHLANTIEHPGIVKILDDGITSDGCVFLVMEMLEGQTLEELRVARGGRIAPAELVELGTKLLDVLASVHDAHIIHRDLKLTNVFLTAEGALKLLDFGLARSLVATIRPKSSITGTIMGTPAFMSPEQARGERENVDARSEVFSVGAMFFALLTGEIPHNERTPERRLIAAATKRARSVLSVIPGLAPDLAELIDRALQFEKRARFASMRDMRAALLGTRVARGLPPLDTDASADADPGGQTVLDMAPPVMSTPSLPPEPLEPEDADAEARIAASVDEGARHKEESIRADGVFSLPAPAPFISVRSDHAGRHRTGRQDLAPAGHGMTAR